MQQNRPRFVSAAVAATLAFTVVSSQSETFGQTPGGRSSVAATSDQEVERTIRIVESRIEETNQAVGNLANRLVEDQKSLAKLVQQLKALQAIPRDAPAQPKATGTRAVEGRVPRMRPAEQDESIVFILENGRVTPVNLQIAMESAFQRANLRGGATKGVSSSPVGHFDVQYEITPTFLSFELVRKTGSEHLGDSLAKFKSPGSESRRLIENTDSKTHYIQFAVYPDSFELFREVRSVAVQHGFEMGFVPMSPGQLISVGGGRGSVN